MAGSARALNRRILMRRPALFLTGLLLIACIAEGAGERHSFLILQHPDRFILFNKYQQRLTTAEYRGLPTVAVMLVVREVDRLGDGLTRCTAVELDGEAFYIRREDDALFTNRGGKATFFRDALALGDTVELHRTLVLKPVDGSGSISLSARTRAARVFSADGKTFVRVLSSGNHAGWLTLPAAQEGSAWTTFREHRGADNLRKDVMTRLAPVVADANRVLQTAFDRCTAPGASRLSPPAFRLHTTADGVVCVLEPAEYAGSFAGSIDALQAEFQRALAGANIHLAPEGGSIVILLR
jgi:hypothetical protein